MHIKRALRIIKLLGIRWVLKAFWIIPIRRNTIFFSAYEGKQYSCNPRAIYEALLQEPEYAGYRYVWEINDPKKQSLVPGKQIHFVRHNSPRYIFAVLTSGILITNSGISGQIPLRKKQLSINTWHGGGAYKRVGYAAGAELSGELYWLTLASRQTTYYISSSRGFTEVMIDSVQLPADRFLPYGMPRNDIFFQKEHCERIRQKVLHEFGLPQKIFVVLYAPTYRGAVGSDSDRNISLDVERLCQALKERFSRDVAFLVRKHYFNQSKHIDGRMISASDYPEMQELLAAADMLITDYSSSIWDFALTGKPCLLYVPDLKEYDMERGFYTHPKMWPGLLCETNEDLCCAVRAFQEVDYAEKLRIHLESMESYDDGKAVERVKSLIARYGVCDICGGKKSPER